MQKIRVIQQWQYNGAVPAPLLEDRSLKQCADLGIDSLQSYVLWSEIEKAPEKIDFSAYDALTGKLARHGLKWTPFFIMGPYYATPRWFMDSPRSVFAQCLEHGRQSRIQSIWNPHLPGQVEHFLKVLAEHYAGSGLVESVLLGISGNWGEALYPAEGCMIGGFHTHQGWWCGDQYARADFRAAMLKKYASLDALNAAWNSAFSSADEITFPEIAATPRWLKKLLVRLWQCQPEWARHKIASARSAILNRAPGPSGHAADRWLDFTEWYTGSMTGWAELWLKTARRYFPDLPLYLVTGGNGAPKLGADFTAQAGLAARYRAGIRITNQTDDYPSSFALTRLASAACRFYGAGYSTEEAAINSKEGVVMRIFDAATSGASSVYFKRLVGLGYDKYTGTFVADGEPAPSAAEFSKNKVYLRQGRPLVDLAVFYPAGAIRIQPARCQVLFHFWMRLRAALDFDLVDERMVADGALASYRFFVLRGDGRKGGRTGDLIAAWMRAGGILLVARDSAGAWPIHEKLPDATLVSADSSCKVYRGGAGYAAVLEQSKNETAVLSGAYFNLAGKYPWPPAKNHAAGQKGVFFGRTADGLLAYDSRNHAIRFEKNQ
jgi:phage tail protein X